MIKHNNIPGHYMCYWCVCVFVCVCVHACVYVCVGVPLVQFKGLSATPYYNF